MLNFAWFLSWNALHEDFMTTWKVHEILNVMKIAWINAERKLIKNAWNLPWHEIVMNVFWKRIHDNFITTQTAWKNHSCFFHAQFEMQLLTTIVARAGARLLASCFAWFCSYCQHRKWLNFSKGKDISNVHRLPAGYYNLSVRWI